MTSTLTNLLQSLRIVPMASKKQPVEVMVVGEATKSIVVVDKQLPELTLQEVADHDSYSDCWVVIYDRVYDVTRFLREHPGGEDVIMDHAGRDATIAFHGTGHSRDAVEMMRQYCIGELPPGQRIFRTNNHRVLSSGIPD